MIRLSILVPSYEYEHNGDMVMSEVCSGCVDASAKDFFQMICSSPDTPIYLYDNKELTTGFIVGRKLFDKSIIEVEEA